jgi:hypothetical protein
MSKNSSNPVRELRYTNNDASVGVPYLQDLGVRYVMLRSTEAQAQADLQPELTLIAESYPWKIYQVAGSDIVVPLDVQPVVVNRRGGDQRERNLELGTSWFQHPDEWPAMPADDGPDEWQRIDVRVDESRREFDGEGEKNRVDVVVPEQAIEAAALDPVQVSNVDIRDQSLSFDVDQVGVPVLVRVSYFPNWEAKGADGPYRVGPNMMVVVPTSNTVRLDFERSTLDNVAYGLTVVGLLCLLAMWLYGPTRHRSPNPALLGDDRQDWEPAEAEGAAGAVDATVPMARSYADDPFDDRYDDPFDGPYDGPFDGAVGAVDDPAAGDRLTPRPVNLDDRYDNP